MNVTFSMNLALMIIKVLRDVVFILVSMSDSCPKLREFLREKCFE
jgi:hypothetical protein